MIYRLIIFSLGHGYARDWAWYFREETAEKKGTEWATHYPDDIVMLVGLEIGICKHCDKKIHENVGWVLHKWAHTETGAYTCWNTELTQAEPKEVA